MKDIQKKYIGIRGAEGFDCKVYIDKDGVWKELPLRHDLINHSDQFEWGYCGSGPSQLSLALLAEHTKDDKKALRFYQQFKGFLFGLNREKWVIDDTWIGSMLELLESGEKHQPLKWGRYSGPDMDDI